MSDPQTPNKFLFTPAHNADVNTWEIPVNANWTGIDQAFGGVTTLNATGLSGLQALTSSQVLPLGFIVTGTPSGNITYQVPAGIGGFYVARNRTSGTSITIGFSSAAGGGTVNIPQGTNVPITADGTPLGMVPILTATGAAAGSNTQVQFNSFGNLSASTALTWDGLTFSATGLNIGGDTVLGSMAGSTLTLNGMAVATPNGLNFNAGLIQFGATGGIGIGIVPTAALLAVGGSIQSTSGGFTFPDASVQTSAASKLPSAIKAAGVINTSNAAVGFTYNASLAVASTGVAVVTFGTPFSNINYVVNVTVSSFGLVGGYQSKTLSSVVITSYNPATSLLQDGEISVTCVGAQ